MHLPTEHSGRGGANLMLLLLLLLLLVSVGVASGESPANVSLSWSGLIEVVTGLGWTQQVGFVHGGGLVREAASLVRAAARRDVAVTALALRELLAAGEESAAAAMPVSFLSTDTGDLPDFFEVLARARYPTEGLLLVTGYGADDPELEDRLRSLDASRAFFLYELGSSTDSLSRVQTFRSRAIVVRNEWEMGTDGFYRREYDFQGAPLTVLTTQNNFPWLYAVPCPHRPELSCYAVGAEVSMMDIFTRMFNFTVEVHIQPDNNWGIVPDANESGNVSRTYSGIFGAIVDDQYDQASSAFQRNLERDQLLDFSVGFIYVSTYYVMDVSKAKSLDWTLYLRPFRADTWFGCGLITVVVVSVYQILSLLQGRGRVSLWRLKEAMKITAFSGWFCFVVVDVYYEGALTMFFTTDKELPFKSIEEALDLYPDYKLLVLEGFENSVKSSLKAGVGGMEEQIRRMEEDEDIMQRDVATMLHSLKRPGTFVLADPRQVGAVLEHMPVEGLSLQKLFSSPPNSGYFSAMYPKRSPWKDALDIGYRHFISSGLMERILSQHAPDDRMDRAAAADGGSDGKDRLDLRQTGLAFTVLCASAGCAVLLLAAELALGSSSADRARQRGRGRGDEGTRRSSLPARLF